jgi:hypothetical protein
MEFTMLAETKELAWEELCIDVANMGLDSFKYKYEESEYPVRKELLKDSYL